MTQTEPIGSCDAHDDAYLARIVRILWPQPARVTTSTRLRRDTRDVKGYVVIPSAAKPKLLVPRRPRRVAAGAVRNFKTTVTAREQLTLRLIGLAIRLGAADLLPDRLCVEYDAGVTPTDVEEHLSTHLDERVRVCLYISPARAVRKPVLQVLDSRGVTIAFAKLGIDTFTRHLVRAEAESVAFLATVPWAVLAVPAVLYAGEWRGNEVLVQSAFAPGRGARPACEELSRAMDELARARGVTRALLAHSTYWHRLQQRIDDLDQSEFAVVLSDSMNKLESRSGATEFEFGSWHGDWAPWNMNVIDGRVCVWDWEKFETGVPIGFDAVHHDVQGAVVLAATPPSRALRNALTHASRLVRPHGVSPTAAPTLVWLYAIDIAVRYLEDREMEAGTTQMSRLSSWLVQVLDAAAAYVPAHEPAGPTAPPEGFDLA